MPGPIHTAGANKIDAALLQGPTQLVAAIEDDFGIPIQHFVELNFDSFAGVVTALGGITMYFPEPVYDAYSGLNSGPPVATTWTASRPSRSSEPDTCSTARRARHRQHRPHGPRRARATWPASSATTSSSGCSPARWQSAASPTRHRPLAGELGRSPATVDRGLSLSAMVNLVLTFHHVTVEKAPQLTVPVLVGTFGSYGYKGGDIR